MSVKSIVNLAAGKLAEIIVQEAKFLYGVEGQVRSLRGELKWMSSFLKDMEAIEEEEGGDQRSRTLITEIRKIAYDAEDAVESYILRVENVDLFKRYACLCFHLWQSHRLGNEVESIKVRITDTMDRLKKYKGGDIHGGRRENLEEGFKRRRPISYSHSNEDHVIGLDQDIENLVGLLITNSELQVLSVVGMGGSGKTTLARKLYNHEKIKGHFECLVWVSISEQWVARHVLLDILRKASGETMKLDENWSPQHVAEKLQEFLERKKYLIVLDDVWARQALEEILPALPLGNDGRKIIVTTRIRELVDYPDLRCCIHEPRRLTDEESWELFRKIALYHKEEIYNTEDIVAFKELGKEMVKKCEGLPLAVVALAGILGKKESVEEWEKLRNAVTSKIMELGRGTLVYGNVKEMLALSYNDLPHELKPCFLYLALFPEDSEIPVGMIIRMWIAEGFITPDQVQEGDTLEDVARQYLDELIHRYVIRVATRNYQGKVKSVQVHDLMRDLCIKKAKEQEFLQLFSSRSSDMDAGSTQSRRTIIHSYNRMYFPFPTRDRHLRSLFLFARANVGIYKMHTLEDRPRLSFKSIHKNFKLLRVLNLVGVDTCDGALPKETGSLIHLRYLGIRVTNIHQLPSSIGNLHNLLTLDYRGLEEYDKPVKVPDVLWKLEGLRHLYLPFDRSSMERLKFHTLKHLQTLWGVGGGDWMLDELPRLSESVQKLHIEGITSVEQLEAAFRCPSIMKNRLQTLYLDWLAQSEGGESLLKNNLEPIIHCQHLRKLGLRGRIEDKLACIQFPSNINKLDLSFTQLEAEATLGCIGKLPSLKYLNLSRCSYMGVKWTCTPGEFLQLRELKLLDLPNLEEWSIQGGAMPQLKRLTIWQCENLSTTPQGLKFITTLEELEMRSMSDEFYNRIKEGEDAHIIQHIPVVRYLD